jgi:hypothetical protein
MPDYRIARPKNPQAAQAADQALYSAYEHDDRPNALFDAAGHKKPFNPDDPALGCLTAEWFGQYEKNGGKLEEIPPKNDKRPGVPVQECPLKKAKLTVNVQYTPLEAPVPRAAVKISGPVSRTMITSPSGSVTFPDLPPGNYTVTATYAVKNSLVDVARINIGKTDWAKLKRRVVSKDPRVPPFESPSNKCNLFVYEMLMAAGYEVPLKARVRKKDLKTVFGPPNAGDDWASHRWSPVMNNFNLVDLPEPGDIIAWSNWFWDASGHVGIVTYPLPTKPETKSLSAGESAEMNLKMVRQTISAGEYSIVEDSTHFWHFYNERNESEMKKIVFRRPAI